VRFHGLQSCVRPQDSAEALNRLAPIFMSCRKCPDRHRAGVIKLTFPTQPTTARSAYGGAIYVVREPADVMLPTITIARVAARGDDPGVSAAIVDQYLAARGDPVGSDRGGAWDAHVLSWLGTKYPFPVLPVRYEDSSRIHSACTSDLSFLGLERTDEEVAVAVSNSSFGRMR